MLNENDIRAFPCTASTKNQLPLVRITNKKYNLILQITMDKLTEITFKLLHFLTSFITRR
jgi:hypothetical protein